MIFDSHAHYNDEKFNSPDISRDELLNKLLGEGVTAIVNASVNVEDSKDSLELSEKFDGIYACVGIHPGDVDKVGDIDSAIAEIRRLASHKKAVAIGEIGLDYYWEPFDKQKQKLFFTKQLDLARELSLPVVIHDRDAHGDVDEIIRNYPDLKIVLHSYSGSAEWAKSLVNDGRYISFSGVVTFKNARRALEALTAVPLDRILIETDCPYLAPTPLRGSVNNSANLIYTAAKIAEIKGVTTEKILEQTYINACRFYNINCDTVARKDFI